MNEITLQGVIKDIQYSHSIGNINYDKANLLVKRKDGKEDLIPIKFKNYFNRYSDNDFIELKGNLRSYSEKLDSGKNKVNLYVFTYFDIPESNDSNYIELDGRICSIDKIRVNSQGQKSIHFILANNILVSGKKINSYIPCVAWGEMCEDIADFRVSDKVELIGELHSRVYKKHLNEHEIEFRVAYEVNISSIGRV